MSTAPKRVHSIKKNSSCSAVKEASGPVATVGLPDHRPAAAVQRRLQANIAGSPQIQQAAASQWTIDQSPRQQAALAPLQKKANRTGLPDNLKAGVENLSGYSLDDVQVHYNSTKPAELQAHAYAQGSDIHVAPGQEQHLPHEAWHVVQQKQGRVRPTRQLKGEVAINDDVGMEKEADVMGGRALYAASPSLKAPLRIGGVSTQSPVQAAGLEEWIPEPVYAYTDSWGIPRPLVATAMMGTTTLAAVMVVAIRALVSRYRNDAKSKPSGPAPSSPIQPPEFLQITSWGNEELAKLATEFATDPGGRMAPEWVQLAGSLALRNKPDMVADFARLPGWVINELETLATKFAESTGKSLAPKWVQLAGNPALHNRPDVVADFALLAKWPTNELGTLATAFVANPGNRSAADWAQVARAHHGLHSQPNAVTDFVRLPNWSVDNLVKLAGAFATNAGNRPAADWAQLAGAPALHNQSNVVAGFARVSNWTPASLITLAAAFIANAGNRLVAEWVQVAQAAASLHNRPDIVVDFARTPGWATNELGALAAAFAANAGNRPAADWAQIAGDPILRDWPSVVAGFARVSNWTPASLITLAAAFATNAGNRSVTEWVQVAEAAASLHNRPDVVADFARIPGWATNELGALAAAFVANAGGHTAAQWGQLARVHATLHNEHALVTELVRMANWTPAPTRDFAVDALTAGLTALRLQAFIGTPGATANCRAVVADWGALGVGSTVGKVLTAAGAPSDAQLVLLLQLVNAHNWPAARLQNAALAASCGPPNWAQVLLRVPQFTAHLGPNGARNQWQGAFVHSAQFVSALGTVELAIRAGGIEHIENGHTFEHLDYTYANCMRNGGGNVSFFASGTDISALCNNIIQAAAAHTIADQAAAGNQYIPGSVLGCQVGIEATGITPAGVRTTIVTMLYPLAGTNINGPNLVAIGRLIGRI